MRFHLLRILYLLVPFSALSQTKESFSVYFGFDRYILTEKALTQLDSFCLKNKNSISHLEFEIKGYCDNRGTENYNYSLSEKRVAAVKEYLLKRGMNIEFVVAASGYGETEPLNENRTEEERQLNRRVDLNILKATGMLKEEKEEIISLKQKIQDTATIAGDHIILRNINFIGGRHHPLPESKPMLDELLDAMKTLPNLVIEIQGHICCQPGDEDGFDLETGFRNLSQERAKTIADWLIHMGIDSNRVSYKGFGHSKPIYSYPEQTEEERIQNRRVEIKIISK